MNYFFAVFEGYEEKQKIREKLLKKSNNFGLELFRDIFFFGNVQTGNYRKNVIFSPYNFFSLLNLISIGAEWEPRPDFKHKGLFTTRKDSRSGKVERDILFKIFG